MRKILYLMCECEREKSQLVCFWLRFLIISCLITNIWLNYISRGIHTQQHYNGTPSLACLETRVHFTAMPFWHFTASFITHKRSATRHPKGQNVNRRVSAGKSNRFSLFLLHPAHQFYSAHHSVAGTCCATLAFLIHGPTWTTFIYCTLDKGCSIGKSVLCQNIDSCITSLKGEKQ